MKLEKITNQSEQERRSYGDACGAAHALDLVGERWSLLVIRELMLGPRRFGDLRSALPGISANVLTQRLEGLEAVGVVAKRKLPPPASVQVYELTPWGYEAEPIFQALGRWATRSPLHDPTLAFSAASLILSLRTMFDAQRAGNLAAKIGIRAAGETILVTISDGALTFERSDLAEAEAVFAGAPPAIAGVIYGGAPLAALEQSGDLVIEGDRALAARFVTLFPLPEKASR